MSKLTPRRWAERLGPEYAKALRLMTLDEVAEIDAGLRASEQIEARQLKVARLGDLQKKLERIIETSKA